MAVRRFSCLVLGGGGFLGINLCQHLVARGHRVRAFGRRCLYPEALRGIEWYQGELSDTLALAAALDGFDVVFHLVHGTTPQSANLDMVGDLQQSVVSSLALLELVRKLSVKRVVFVSSGGTVYGPGVGIPTPETAATEPITAYGIGKLAVEKYLALYEHLYGIEHRILRVANPFGPFQVTLKNQGIIAALISRGMCNEPIEIWGDGSVVRDYIYVSDVIEALEKAVHDNSEWRIFNIGSGYGQDLRQVIEAVGCLLNVKLKIDWRDSRPIDAPMSVLDVTRAKTALGWSPSTPFEMGLKQTIEWWKSILQTRG